MQYDDSHFHGMTLNWAAKCASSSVVQYSIVAMSCFLSIGLQQNLEQQHKGKR